MRPLDKDFTLRIRQWLDQPAADRDIAAGAGLLLRLTANRIQYASILRDPAAHAEWLEARLRQQYDFRVLDLTAGQVAELDREAERIIEEHHLDDPAAPAAQADGGDEGKEDPGYRGRRPDHDLLPDDIKALWTENFTLLRRIRECHLKLRMLTLTDHPCPDSERYPFLKEMIRLDRRLHANWKAYDLYKAAARGETEGETPAQKSPQGQ